MENIQRVTAHLAAQVAGEPDSGRRVLTLIPAQDGKVWHVDAEGSYWRAYHFIERARTYDAVESTDQAFQAAKRIWRDSRSCSPACPRRDCTIPSPTSTTRPSDLPRWSRPSPPTLPAARPWQSRRLNSPWRTNPSPASCWMRTCLSALPTTTPSSTTSCSTTPPAKAFASSTSIP